MKIKVPAKMSAMATDSSVALVKKVRAGKRVTGDKAKKVQQAEELLEVGMSKLVEEVKRVVNF